ncbi:MAG: hypothetical protein H6828_02730 [Planctomycetes bacterium]|nr:hypothetical protein [Planctomycetota bacterium]
MGLVRRSSAVLLCALAAACAAGEESPPPATTRTWAMGFAPTPPVLTTPAVLQGVDLWSQRAEFAVIHEELPWTELLAGTPPEQIVQDEKVGLVDYMRQRGVGLFFMIDLTDGLSRSEEAPQLRDLGRSLAEPEVRDAARAYALAVVDLLQPEYLGCAAETNLIRRVAPPTLYDAVVTTANAIAQDVGTRATPPTLFVSVQVETAWGLFTSEPYLGIAQDVCDFPFAEALGLSSYPYFVHATPADLPSDYYARLVDEAGLPSFVAEGGWTSASVGTVSSTPARQADYLRVQAALLDGVDAFAWLQLLFADPDLTQWPQPQPANLPLFTSIGLCTSDFTPKPALAVWDELHARPLVP